MASPLIVGGVVVAVGAAVWGIVEARSVVLTDRMLFIPELPAGLEGLRIAHISDLHLGAAGVNRAAATRAIELVAKAAPDLIAVTGDLLSHPRGTDDLLDLLSRLEAPLGVFATLGNHDLGDARDPFSRVGDVPDLAEIGVCLLRNKTVVVEHAGRRIAVTGLEPLSLEGHHVLPQHGLPSVLPWPAPIVDMQLVLAHFPDVFDAVPSGVNDLILTGHLHGGQICVPWPTGRLRLSQLGHRYTEGVYRRGKATMHLSRGVGTTFVPFRVFARPEVTVLELRLEG